MFEEHQQGPVPMSYTPPAITLACGCAGLTVSFGLCGMGLAINHGNGGFLLPLAVVVFGISILAILISVPWLIVAVITNAVRNKQ